MKSLKPLTPLALSLTLHLLVVGWVLAVIRSHPEPTLPLGAEIFFEPTEEAPAPEEANGTPAGTQDPAQPAPVEPPPAEPAPEPPKAEEPKAPEPPKAEEPKAPAPAPEPPPVAAKPDPKVRTDLIKAVKRKEKTTAEPVTTPAPKAPAPAPTPTKAAPAPSGPAQLWRNKVSQSGYKTLLRQKVESLWKAPTIERDYQILYLCKIKPDGRIDSLSLEESSGLDLLDQGAKKAILDASPFPAPPPEVLAGAPVYEAWFRFHPEEAQ